MVVSMAAQNDKNRRSNRLHADDNAIRKQVKIAKAYGIEIKEPHKLIKHHALDCGNPNCVMCGNPRKVWGEKTMQEKRFDETIGWIEE